MPGLIRKLPPAFGFRECHQQRTPSIWPLPVALPEQVIQRRAYGRAGHLLEVLRLGEVVSSGYPPRSPAFGRLAINLVALAQRIPDATAHLFGFVFSDRARQVEEAEAIEFVSLLTS
jgi:hypothetical protein